MNGLARLQRGGLLVALGRLRIITALKRGGALRLCRLRLDLLGARERGLSSSPPSTSATAALTGFFLGAKGSGGGPAGAGAAGIAASLSSIMTRSLPNSASSSGSSLTSE